MGIEGDGGQSGEQDQNPFGLSHQEYWDLLSPEERMMQFDEYGLYALTPRCFSEPILEHIQGNVVVDACCSVGGMTIPMAQSGKHVIAIELDPHRLELAKKNAEIFGAQDRITFISGDVLEEIPKLSADTIFFDGQWVGQSTEEGQLFTLSDFSPNGKDFLTQCFKIAKCVIFRVPANFDFSELEQFPYQYRKEPTVVDGETVAYTVYWENVSGVGV